MRGLVRRIQNRGYATLARIADHIDSLTAGDESNAVIEALDAVNLMTVHAAKGLEFPVVFVVNLSKGASGPPRPIRVTVDGEGGAPSVSVGPFVSESDEAEREREKHETRRLLYVALTRARDRLYLSSVLKNGVMQPGRGSLAEVLPDSVRALFSQAATAVQTNPPRFDGRDGQAVLSSGAFASCRRRPRRRSWRRWSRADADDSRAIRPFRSRGRNRSDAARTGTWWLETPERGGTRPRPRRVRSSARLVHRLLQSWDGGRGRPAIRTGSSTLGPAHA